MAYSQKELQNFIKRRHPCYAAMLPHWQFIEETYEGGRGWFKQTNLFRYLKEGEREYKERIERAYRFNHTREVVDLVNKNLFRCNIMRDETRAPESVKSFWGAATLGKQDIDEFARLVGKQSSIYGRVWVVVDTNNSAAPGAIVSKKDAKAAGFATYAYTVAPDDALDMGYDDAGNLTWILIQEKVRDDSDPITSSGAVSARYRLWTDNTSQLFTIEGSGSKQKIVVEAAITHGLGEVPVIAADHGNTDDQYCAPGLIDDIAYLDRAVANYLSNLDAIIQDQTFSQLAMPSQNLKPGDDDHKKLLDAGTKRIFTFDADGTGSAPFFLSPDPKQAAVILSVVHKIINEIYHSAGLAGERTKEDNSMGIDNSSGVAKAYDFERVNALLIAKADAMESFENKLCRLVAKWNGETVVGVEADDVVEYPDDFDVRGLYDEFEIAARLSLLQAPNALRREQMQKLAEKLYPQQPDAQAALIAADLKTWPPQFLDVNGNPAAAPSTITEKATASL